MRRHASSWWEQAVHNRLVAVVLAMAVCVPLIAAPMAEQRPLVAVAAYAGFAVFMLALMVWRANLNWNPENIRAFFRTGANTPVLLYLGLVLVSCLLSPHKAYGLQEALRVGAGALLYFTIVYHFRRSEYVSKLIDTLLFLAIAASLVGFAQFAGSHNDYASGLFGDHQLFGSFLMILLPILAVTAITEVKPERQLAAQIATVLTVACLLITHTRSAWIGAAAGLVTLAVVSLAVGARRNKVSGRKDRLVLPIMLLVVSAGFFLLVWPQTSSILGRATTLSSVSEEAGWQYRLQMWRGTLQMVKERPLTGFGAGLYPYYEQAYTHSGMPISCISGDRPSCPDCSVRPAAGAIDGNTPASPRHEVVIGPTLGEQAHSLYLQTLAELGIPGLLCLAAIPITFVAGALLRLRTMDAGIRRNILIGALGSIVAFAVDAFGSPSWQLGQVSMFFWLILGLGVTCLRPQAKHEEVPAARKATRALRPVFALASIGLLAILPMIALACPDASYGSLKSLSIEPHTDTVNSGTPVQYTLTATFSNHAAVNVTCCPGSSFMVIGKSGGGSGLFTQSGCNGSIVTPTSGKATYRVIGKYVFGGTGSQAQAELNAK